MRNNISLKFILSQLGDFLLIKKTQDFLEKKDTIFIGEIGKLGKILLLLSFIEREVKNILFITSNKNGLANYSNSLRNLGENSFFELLSNNAVDFLASGKKLVLSDINTLLEKTISPEEYKKNIITLKVGDDIPEYLNDYLVENGYEKVKKVGQKGEFSIRGDIIDIFCGKNPVRIEFFGKKIEKIYYFNPFTFKKVNVGAVHKPPEKVDIYPQIIKGDNGFLINFFDNYLLVFDGEDQINNSILSSFQNEGGEVLPSNIKSLSQIEDFIKKRKRVYLEDFFVNKERGINLSWFAPKNYSKMISDWILDLKEMQKKDIKVFIYSEHVDKINKYFSDNRINFGYKENITLIKGKLDEGVNLAGLGITIFSDKEIFARRKKKTFDKFRSRKKIDFSAITNLKKGEYVVHIDHGIGRFVGFGEIAVDKVKREYVFIEYSKGDKIYVPLDQADKITKYISVGNQSPVLSSLASGNWLKVRKKVEKNVENIAKELLETQAFREVKKTFHYINDQDVQEKISDDFPYRETKDQKKAIEDVLSDMNEDKPMDRIIVGDVGYGKTEVSIRATVRAVESGGQVAFLVPTTILAEQHLLTFRERLSDLGIKIESLSRFRSKAEQKKILNMVRSGSVDVIIGTHRLLSSDIKFKNLTLVIIDEEQKFGVKHKEKLKKLRASADILTMTATPIPRTLYLGLGGLKDISLISTPPEGRLPIKTIVAKKDDEIIKSAIKKEVSREGRVYFVHNRVETIDAVAVKLKKILPRVKFEVAHGQMKEQDLAKIMNDFAKGKFQVLICSTIIESGLDISNVNTLIVDRSTHLGLSQLHQLRGRIGRGAKQAYAYFLYSEKDLKGNAQRRLKSIVEKGELGAGYQLSLEDLDIRGSGNILGKEQHGSMQMVGIGYYLRLLEEAVGKQKINLSATLKTGKSIKQIDVKIDLPISTFIPDGFYKKEEDKIRTYQALAGLEEESELNNFIAELKSGDKSRFVPMEMQNLFNIIRLKIKAKKAGIKSIIVKDVLTVSGAKKKKLYIDFDHFLSKHEVQGIFSINSSFYFGNTQVKIDLDKLGEEWFRKINLIMDELIKK